MARRLIARRAVLVLALLVLGLSSARADRIDTLTQSLLGDPSWRVKVQAAITLGRLKTREPRAVMALIEALRDSNEAVRAVAAETLGKLGDAAALDPLRTACSDGSPGVRTQAKKALASLERAVASAGAGGGGSSAPHWFVEVSGIAPGKAAAEDARKVHDRAVRELGRVPGVTLDAAVAGPSPSSRYWLDGNILKLAVGSPDVNGRVHTDCTIKVILATLPDKSIKLMATVDSSVEGTSDPRDLEGAKSDCLIDAAKLMSEKVQSYLETHR